MLVPAAVLVLLSFGPRSVFSFSSVVFSSVKQCGSFDIQFSGGKPPAALPLTLTVVPFDSTPVLITIPNFRWDSTTATGAAVTFLPFPAETQFVASLDDVYGFPTGNVSGITQVLPSGNTTCLPNASSVPPRRYNLENVDELAECQPFDVLFDPRAVDVPPLVRGFIPSGDSFYMNRTASAPGDATYILSAPAKSQVALMFSDDTGFKQASPLLAVGEPPNNATATCLPPASASKAGTILMSNSSGLSKTSIIVIGVVSGAVVGGIALAMTIWIVCQRRKADKATIGKLEEADPDALDGGPGAKEKAWADRNPTVVVQSPNGTKALPHERSSLSNIPQYVKNPPYADKRSNMTSSTSSQPSQYRLQGDMSDSSRSSGGLPDSIPVPVSTPQPFASSSSESRAVASGSGSSRGAAAAQIAAEIEQRPDSLSSDDIEQILEMATIYNPGAEASRRSAERMETVTLASTVQSTTHPSGIESQIMPAMPMPRRNSLSPPERVAFDEEHSRRLPPPVKVVTRKDSGDSGVALSSALSGQWTMLTAMTPNSATYRNPPQAPMPSTPTSDIMFPPTVAWSLAQDESPSRPYSRYYEALRKAPRVLPREYSTHSRRPTDDTLGSILPDMR